MLFGIFGCVGQCRPQVWTLVLHVSVVGFCNDCVMWFLMVDPFDSCRFCEWLQALFTSSLPCLTPVIMVLTCYTNIFLQHLLCPALSLWPRRSSPQIICPQIICYICQLCLMATVDLLSKGDTQKGWEKVTATSVMDVLKWHTGDYRVLVQDAEPMVVPWTDSCDKFWTCFFPVPATLWRMTNMIRLEINDSWNKLWQIH